MNEIEFNTPEPMESIERRLWLRGPATASYNIAKSLGHVEDKVWTQSDNELPPSEWVVIMRLRSTWLCTCQGSGSLMRDVIDRSRGLGPGLTQAPDVVRGILEGMVNGDV